MSLFPSAVSAGREEAPGHSGGPLESTGKTSEVTENAVLGQVR